MAEDYYENDTQYGEPMQIGGDYQQKPVKAADRIKRMRKMLEKQTERMVQKQIQQERLKMALEERKRLIKMFNQNMKALDAIQ